MNVFTQTLCHKQDVIQDQVFSGVHLDLIQSIPSLKSVALPRQSKQVSPTIYPWLNYLSLAKLSILGYTLVHAIPKRFNVKRNELLHQWFQPRLQGHSMALKVPDFDVSITITPLFQKNVQVNSNYLTYVGITLLSL